MKGRYQGTSEEASEQSPDGNAGKEGEMKKEAKEGIEKYTVHFSPVILLPKDSWILNFSILFFEFFLCFRFVGSDCEDNEDEKENNERRSSDGIGGNS